jgi:hypothetical protein
LALATCTNQVRLELGKISYVGPEKRLLRKLVETDGEGRFTLPAEIDNSVLVVAHESGYAEITTLPPHAEKKAARKQPEEARPQDNQALRITLQPWGRVEGRIMSRDKPVAGAKLWVYRSRGDHVSIMDHGQNVVSDADGRFVVERMSPGGAGICQRYIENRKGEGGHHISGLVVDFDVLPGKTTTLRLGSPGRTLTGKLATPDGFPHKVDWSKVAVKVNLRFPTDWQDEESVRAWSNFQATEEGKLYSRTNIKPAADGSFRIEDLPAAEYDLEFVLDGKPVIGDKKTEGEVARGGSRFSVPAVPPTDATKPIDLGTIKVVPSDPSKPS